MLLDRAHGQLALAKFLIEADRAPGVDAESGWARSAALADRVREQMAQALRRAGC